MVDTDPRRCRQCDDAENDAGKPNDETYEGEFVVRTHGGCETIESTAKRGLIDAEMFITSL